VRIALPPLDLADQLRVVVDPDATPADWDAAVGRFLLRLVDKWKNQTAPADPATELSIFNPGENERICHHATVRN
jgi:hypothetical protein